MRRNSILGSLAVSKYLSWYKKFLYLVLLVSLNGGGVVFAQITEVAKPLLENIRGGQAWLSPGYGFEEKPIWRYGIAIEYGLYRNDSLLKSHFKDLGSRIRLLVGYEYSSSYLQKLEKFESTVPLGQVYLAGLITVCRSDSLNHGLYVGTGVGFASLSNLAGIAKDPSNEDLPLKYSAENSLATEVYFGYSFSNAFFQVSYQYIKFVSINYNNATGAQVIQPNVYLTLPRQLIFHSVFLSVGMTFP